MSFAEELRLPRREHDAHKGNFGRVLIVAGSRGMAGAAVLATGACLRSGVGLLTVAAPASAIGQVAFAHNSAMTLTLPETQRGIVSLAAISVLKTRLATFDAVAVGPGLGQSEGVTAFVVWLWNHCPCPLVVDADGLNALARGIRQNRVLASQPTVGEAGANRVRVLTPHWGEYQRLQSAWAAVSGQLVDSSAGVAVDDESVLSLAEALGGWVVLKGSPTRITDGQRIWRNRTGNPGMASGGSGDCLTGVMVACLASRCRTDVALRRACYAHGLAGDLAAAELGQHAMNAEDLADYLPSAWKTLESE